MKLHRQAINYLAPNIVSSTVLNIFKTIKCNAKPMAAGTDGRKFTSVIITYFAGIQFRENHEGAYFAEPEIP